MPPQHRLDLTELDAAYNVDGFDLTASSNAISDAIDGITFEPPAYVDVEGARVLALLGDSVTTDHISPAGAIKEAGPAGHYLREQSHLSRRDHVYRPVDLCRFADRIAYLAHDVEDAMRAGVLAYEDLPAAALRTFGEPGNGPGQFGQQAGTVLVGRGDTILVPDIQNQRVALMTADGEDLGSFRIGFEDGVPRVTRHSRRNFLRNGAIGMAAVYGASKIDWTRAFEAAKADAAADPGNLQKARKPVEVIVRPDGTKTWAWHEFRKILTSGRLPLTEGPPESLIPTKGAPAFKARSITLHIFSAWVSEREPPKTVKSWLNKATGLPSIFAKPVTTPSPG